METIYKSKCLEIKSYDFIDNSYPDMIDFFILFDGIEYSCSAFTLDYVNRLIKSQGHIFFWSIGSIVVREGTKDCLIKAILEMVNDKALDLDSIFIKSQ